jgi:hypothetical protein
LINHGYKWLRKNVKKAVSISAPTQHEVEKKRETFKPIRDEE